MNPASPLSKHTGALIGIVLLAIVALVQGAEPEAKPDLYVVAAQIDTKVLAKGETPNSREARLLEKLATERSTPFYAKVHTRVLTAEEASRDNILKEVDWLQRNVRKQDVAVVFLAGHGVYNLKTKTYSYRPVGGSITGTELRTAFDKIPGRNILLLQTCQARAALEVAGEERPFRNTLVLAACDDDEKATRLMGMVMVNGLAGLVANPEGTVTTKSLSRFLEQRVRAVSEGKQTLHVSRPEDFSDFPIAPKGKAVEK